MHIYSSSKRKRRKGKNVMKNAFSIFFPVIFHENRKGNFPKKKTKNNPKSKK